MVRDRTPRWCAMLGRHGCTPCWCAAVSNGGAAVNGVARGPRASAADKGRSGGLDRGPDLAGADRA